MTQMQRSISLPGQSHSSPLLSSTYLFDRHGHPSQSPVATSDFADSSQTTSLHESENINRDASKHSETAKSDDTAPLPQLPRSIKGDAEDYPVHRSGNGPPGPLLQDVSEYSNTHLLLDAGNEAIATTLEELAHLVRLSKYQERKRSQSRIRLQRSLVSTALSARLVRCGEAAHKTLVENFRVEDKKSFATLYNAIDDVKKSCDAMRRYSLLEPELDIGRPKDSQHMEPGSFYTFMHEIPGRSRDVLFNLLSQIRTNPDFLPGRISSLTSPELSALTSFHQESNESILPFHTRARGQTSVPNRSSLHSPSPVERLLSFQRHDPLSALIHTCFANSAGPDSAEDLRRTEIWGSVCAKLITESKGGAESFIGSVLHIWTSMREWSGRSNMEWFLMKILEDGAFLLEKAEDQAGTRIHVEPRNAKDSIAADDFYDSAVKGLFEVVDDPRAGGIPEGLLELGNAILRKLDPKRHNHTKVFLVSKWLFSNFLLNAIVHPESCGMMSEYHITQYGRQKILKEVAIRASKIVVDLTWKKIPLASAEMQTHIENIWGRFNSSKTTVKTPKLLPARSITSLRETIEVHPYLVISPSDLVTIVNALYPERRPASSSMERDTTFSGLRSAASSISGVSGLSAQVFVPTQRTFDTASIISTTESNFSDATSHAPLLDDSSTNQFSSTSISSMSQGPRFEDEGSKIRLALRDMSHTLGAEVTIGSCHPCAERWAVLFLDSSGEHLSSQMLHDIDDEFDEDENSSSSDSEEEYGAPRPDLDCDYHELRDAILKLVEEFEIPQTLHSKKSRTFSNRTALESHRKKAQRNKSRTVLKDNPSSNNPYRFASRNPKKGVDTTASTKSPAQSRLSSRTSSPENADTQSVLFHMLEAAESQCKSQADFVNAHVYWRTTQQLMQISSPTLVNNGFVSLLNIFSRGPRDSIRVSTGAIEEYEAWMVWLKQSQERHDITTDEMMELLKGLRDKMWYVVDVRNSSPYDQARNVAVALKTMGMPKKRTLSNNGNRPRNLSRSSANSYLLRTEAQVLDMLSAPDEYGGPNKLTDEQAEKTEKYLKLGIENFCKGEERIHRFCLEIENCVGKLIGEDMISAPDLWASDLYSRDKRVLDSGRQKGDIVMSGFGTLSISGHFEQQIDSGRRSLRGMGVPTSRPGLNDLRAMSARNGSQQSFDSGRWSMSKASMAADTFDTQDYFGMASPVLTIDSTTTFWSPFQTRVHSPTTTISSYRPGTASTTNDTVIGSGEDPILVTKRSFLEELKKTLTTLLISDLGTLVFARGSETDFWFSGDLGRECMRRKERRERQDKKRGRRRVIEKKKSIGDLRSANRPNSAAEQKESKRSAGSDSMTDSTSTLENPKTGSRPKRAKKESSSCDFPYKASFKRLLRMFQVHPNPYAKLNALYDLEQMIIASLTTASRRRPIRPEFISPLKHDGGYTHTSEPHSRTQTLDEAVDAFRERRLSTIGPSKLSSPLLRSSRNSIGPVPSPTSTDAIVDVLQDLFQDASMLPSTLFRDLQFIAAFVPASILDKTDKGKAFWDAGLAALGLKQDICRMLVEVADEIVLDYTKTRGAGGLPSGTRDDDAPNRAPGKEDEESNDVPKYDMQDAARMWTITAKEADAVAERELAIFYLTHPELVERTTLPMTRPKETFKAMQGGAGWVGGGSGGGVGGWVSGVSSGAWKGSGGDGGERDRERSDPATMCVAYHWMELSARGGDELAKKYLRQREELNALP